MATEKEVPPMWRLVRTSNCVICNALAYLTDGGKVKEFNPTFNFTEEQKKMIADFAEKSAKKTEGAYFKMKMCGKCEFCGNESDAASGDHIICTRCTEVITRELWRLKDDETAAHAYKRAHELCRLYGKIDRLLDENEALKKEIETLYKRGN